MHVLHSFYVVTKHLKRVLKPLGAALSYCSISSSQKWMASYVVFNSIIRCISRFSVDDIVFHPKSFYYKMCFKCFRPFRSLILYRNKNTTQQLCISPIVNLSYLQIMQAVPFFNIPHAFYCTITILQFLILYQYDNKWTASIMSK